MTFQEFLPWIDFGFLAYFSFINLFYTFFLLLGAFKIFKRIKEVKEEDTSAILSSNSLPSILFVMPMYNEAENIVSNIFNLLSISYRYKQIIAVNDGSTDNTYELLQKAFDLIEIPKYYVDELPTQKIKAVYRSKSYPEVIVIDKERGGKFDAINSAVNAAHNPFFVVLDADTFLDSKGFEALIRPILTTPQTIAVGATVRILNGCTIEFNRISTTAFPKDFLPAVQSLEYLRAFLLRQGFDAINGNFIVSGAFSIFPRDLIVQVGGFAPTVGEDVEIITRLHRIMRKSKTPYKIKYLPDPVAWTVAPGHIKGLSKQRINWHFGLLQTIWFHKTICFNPKYTGLGLFGFPFWLFGEALEPCIETLAWIYVFIAWGLGVLNVPFFLMFLAVSFGYTALYTFFSLAIEEFGFRKYPSLRNLIMLVTSNLLENIGYRQITVYWRLRSFCRFFAKFKETRKTSRYINDLVEQALLKLPKK
ncbi:MAG: glycosyl transferase [Chlamydiae bacterium CG10_big_fil_rev_8_21_14_0_10_42_34]|nr:MAG: glycosyl transferase [Chlamydiae bacterium CG10_big_fil_rev_8_21_14_0_10_42_34]